MLKALNTILLSSVCLLFVLNCSGQTPGGVTSSTLKLWFKSNQGVTTSGINVSRWNDISGQGNVTSQPSKSANSHAILKNSGANYNPTIFFDGSRLEQLKGAANNLGGIPTLFTVSRSINTATFNPIFSNVEINPAVPDPNTAKEVGPGLFIYFDYYVVDANEAWLPYSADAPAMNNKLDIMTALYGSSTSTANSELYQNGLLKDLHTGSTKVVTPGKKTIEIGGRSADDADYPGRIFNGDIAEIIYFTNRLNSTDRQKVESYLAIKYGITLSNNYLSSNASVVYSVSSFNNRIIGIGRDDASALNQKQSKGENFIPVLEIALNNFYTDNNSNSSTFSADKTFLITGDDDQALTGTTTGVPAGIESWLMRKWKITVTGSQISNSLFQMPSSVLNTIPGTNEISILFADDALFTSGLKSFKMIPGSNNYSVKIPSLLPSTSYFTFVRCNKPLAGNDTTICDSPTTTFDFTDAASYEVWQLLGNPSGSSPTIDPVTGFVSGITANGAYSFVLSNTICQCFDTITLYKGTTPVISSVSSNSPICENQSLKLFASTTGNYSWSGPNGFTSSVANPVINSVSQNYSGTYILSSGILNCSISQTITVIVNPKPILTVSPDTTICYQGLIPLSASGGITYLWSPSNSLSSSNISNPIANPVITTTYKVRVGNNYNCFDSAYMTIYIDQALCTGIIYFPKAFSPNNDGLNDIFRAANGYSVVKDFELRVYNRWGELVFQTKDPRKGWDGKLNNMIQGTNIFVWTAGYTLINGKSYFRKGTILLIK